MQRYLNAVIRLYHQEIAMRVLNVAEKNDAAKNIAGYLSRGNCIRREGLSKFNKIYEFKAQVKGQNCEMVMTSVSGHLFNYNFISPYNKWQAVLPLTLFEAPIVKSCIDANGEKIKKTLQNEVKFCNILIIWTDCDREGENIGFEIIEVCKAVKSNLKIYRAKFSEITQTSVDRALQNLDIPNKIISDAVNVRSELDLRIGAAFTRFQTMRLQNLFPRNLAQMIISYGPCQFPTLGFVVERFLAIDNFEPENYWKLKVTHLQNDLTVEFRWARNRLFEKLPCEVLLDKCQDNPEAIVKSVISKPKSKWRPLPLDTIELEKQSSRHLHLSAKRTMQVAEKLYVQGLISYPRTETNKFPKEMDLVSLVRQLTSENAVWGSFAQRVLEEGVTPRQGTKSDQAHPPIHPTKYIDNLQGDEGRLYEFIVRQFLACVSKNAEGYETIVNIEIAGEKFLTNGLQIIAKNYLDVFIYEKWNAKEIHIYERDQTFIPTSIEMVEETTSPPKLLTEADLILLMDKYGIGTDATHADHIEKVKSRFYVGLKDNKYLMPGKLGIGLVMGYDRMGFEMSKPRIRAELERDLQLICSGEKQAERVKSEHVRKYRELFKQSIEKVNMIDNALAEYLDEQPSSNSANMPPSSQSMRRPDSLNDTGYESNISTRSDSIQTFARPAQPTPSTGSNSSSGAQNQVNNNYQAPSAPTGAAISNFDWNESDNSEIMCNCHQVAKKLCVRKMGPNQGRYFYKCSKPAGSECNFFLWASDNDSEPSYSSAPTAQRAAPNNRNQNLISQSNWQNYQNSSSGWQNNQNSSNDWQNNQNSSSGWQNNQNSSRSWQNNQNSSSNRQNNQNSFNHFGNRNDAANPRSDNNEPICRCGNPAKRLTVHKEGPNKGREFYSCPQGPGSPCNFFQWAESVDSTRGGVRSTSPTNYEQVRGHGRGRGAATGGRGDGGSAPKRTRATNSGGNKRRCGVCGVEGHTRRTCPHNAMD